MALLDQVMSGLRRKPAAEPEDGHEGDDSLAGDDYVPFKVRFLAWWDGVETEDILARESETKTEEKPKTAQTLVIDDGSETSEKKDEALAARLDVLRRLWGEGFTVPGGEAFVTNMIEPCDLDPSKSVLDLSAGWGGSTRVIASAKDVPVFGMEPSAELAEAGMAISVEQGLDEKAPVKSYDIDDWKLPGSGFECAIAREVLFTVSDKAAFLKRIRGGLAIGGHLVFTDYVLTDDEPPNDIVTAWREAEPVHPYPWTLEYYRGSIGELGFEVSLFEDITPQYCRLATSAWEKFMKELDKPTLTRAFANAMLLEAELWQKRLAALKSGRVSVLRVHAKKRETATMSEW